MKHDTSREADAVSREVPHPEDNTGGEFVRPLGVPINEESVNALIESIQEKIDRAIASRDHAEAVRRIHHGIALAEAGNQ